MSLSHYEQSRLCRIEASLCRSDPKLAGMLGMFGRLCTGQRMPAWEQAPSRAFAGRRPHAAARLAGQAGDTIRLGLALLNLSDTVTSTDPVAGAEAPVGLG